MAKPSKRPDPLGRWLALDWSGPEPSYYPDVRDFLADLLGYSRSSVVTVDAGGSGYPDIKLLSPEGHAWVVGEVKPEDAWLTDPGRRDQLWREKRKYVNGLTRYVLFLTPHYIWVVLPNGEPAPALPSLLDLRSFDVAGLQRALGFLSLEAS